MRATLGVVMAVCFSAHTTSRAICPDFFSRRMVVDPMVSVSPTFRSTASFVFMARTPLHGAERLRVFRALDQNQVEYQSSL